METLFTEIVALGGGALGLSVIANVWQARQITQKDNFIQNGYASFSAVMGEVKVLLELLSRE